MVTCTAKTAKLIMKLALEVDKILSHDSIDIPFLGYVHLKRPIFIWPIEYFFRRPKELHRIVLHTKRFPYFNHVKANIADCISIPSHLFIEHSKPNLTKSDFHFATKSDHLINIDRLHDALRDVHTA